MLTRLVRGPVLSVLVALSLFWLVLAMRIPTPVSQSLSNYSAWFLLLVLAAYYASFRIPGRYAILLGLGLTMALCAISLSYRWTSGYSDTGLIGGLLPYKDAKDYYTGAVRLVDGLPLDQGIRAMRRPLSSGLMASLLLLTGQDLALVVALLVQLTGVGLYLSARPIRGAFGAVGAALYCGLMFFYIQPMLGYTMSEIPGFMLGCWAFAILWPSADRGSWPGIVVGLLVLMAAVSARAGAFLIFPALVMWAGWVFRGDRRFSWKAAGIVAGVSAISYALMNMGFPAVLGVPPGSGFGSFIYAMYGQVHGGTGWHSGIADLNTNAPRVIAQAALSYFLAHPLDFFIAAAKSYRDLFLPGPLTIFSFGSFREPAWLTYVLWAATMALILWGLIRAVRQLRLPVQALVVAGMVGILLSVPFLPPIDAGARFQASTIPFLFVLPAVALVALPPSVNGSLDASRDREDDLAFSSYSGLTLLVLMAIAPVLIYLMTPPLSPVTPTCPSRQRPFVIRTSPGSYIDVLPGTADRCGSVGEVCLASFVQYGTEKAIDDFFQDLLVLQHSSQSGLRITPAINLLDTKFHYFVDLSPQPTDAPTNQVVSGCAVGMPTKNQSIYLIDSSSVISSR